MKLYSIDTGMFKLDGGAMFGVVPKSIWHKLNPADDNNMCSWAMRCLLIEDGNRLILIDNGIGDKQDESFFKFYYLHGEASLQKSLAAHGFSPADVTDVILTHLHFDHCGGGVKRKGEGFELTFPNATYWSHKAHWDWATIKPNPREKASFLKENILPMMESGHLRFVDDSGKFDHQAIDFLLMDGHTEKQMLPRIKYKDQTIVFVADLLPSSGHIPLPYIMAYDMRPLQTLVEKEKFLNMAEQEKYILFFEHDPLIEACTLQNTSKGIRLNEKLTINSI